MTAADARSTDSMRFLALGDSYTIGEGVQPNQRWPVQLVRRLASHGIELDAPQIIATTGWTTDELSAAMDATTFTPPYALVSLLIGVNNQYRGRDLDNYRAEFTALLERAVVLAGGRASRVVVVSIPDWGVTRFARSKNRDAELIAGEIDRFNAAARRISEQHDVAFVDVTVASREAGDSDSMLVADGLHPSAAQYAAWTDAIFPVALRALGPAQ